MKKIFPGYFRPTQTEFDEIWRTGLIVPDTNILLHLLRYGPKTRKEVLETLRALAPRVWVPNRVAFEFLRKWRIVDAGNRSAYEKLKKDLQKDGEPPRVCRRLQLLRGWSHGEAAEPKV